MAPLADREEQGVMELFRLSSLIFSSILLLSSTASALDYVWSVSADIHEVSYSGTLNVNDETGSCHLDLGSSEGARIFSKCVVKSFNE